ncbi:MAG: NAD-dependent epimerase/dehydratase family protein [Chloroflexota bacterium]|nr:NAD-dependent epimerase/dehydratase family protein [Chloroflexota bacterium]
MAMNGAVPKVVAVTGAAGYLGSRLVRRLAAEPQVERVFATDARPPPYELDKVVYYEQDLLDPLAEAFAEHQVEALAHLAFVIRQQRRRGVSHRVNVDGADHVLAAAAQVGVERVVHLSSSTVYGAQPSNPAELTEDAPARPSASFHYAWDKREAERAFEEYARERPCAASILRCCIVMGPSARNSITQALSKPLLVGVRNADPPIQFVHEDDLIEVLWRFISEPHPGVFNVAAPGAVCWSEVGRMARRRIAWLPSWAAYGLTDLAWTLRLQSDAPSAGLDYVRWLWAVSTAKLEREVGYAFRYDARQALEAWLAARR